MTIAETRGKLATDLDSVALERSEDLLTSDVFGTMRYLGGGHAFLNWLRSATPAGPGAVLEGQSPSIAPTNAFPQLDPADEIQFAFWPTFDNGREPDVAIFVRRVDRPALLVCVEAKYFSGTSDFAVGAPDGIVTDEPRLTGNQIADQMTALAHLEPSTVGRWFNTVGHQDEIIERVHLYVTADSRMPAGTYQETRTHFPDGWLVPAFWLSWRSLTGFLLNTPRPTEPGPAALVDDLEKLLRRKGLIPFAGFQELTFTSDASEGRFWTRGWWRVPAFTGGAVRFWCGPNKSQ